MCTQQRWIQNKYDGTRHYVKCGHCSACRQEKSIERKNRIDSEFKSGRECIFVTLSYADPYVPYIKTDEAINFLQSRAYEMTEDNDTTIIAYQPTLNVYRDFHAQQSNHGLVVKKLQEPLKTYRYNDFTFHGKKYIPKWKGLSQFKNLHYERHGQHFWHQGKIGVLNFDDIKQFYSKLKKYLKRRGYEERYEIFYNGEYGGDYERPHYHMLLSVSKGHYQLFKEAILACWPYADHSVLEREVEVPRDPASYLASYVNCGEDLPSLLSDSPPFRPRHKYSHGFGMSVGEFTYDAVSQSVNRGSLEYDVFSRVNGVYTWHSVPIPKYVVNRYFPKWKGFGRLAYHEVFNVLQRPSAIIYYKAKCDLTSDDCHNIIRRLRNLRNRLFPHGNDSQWYDYICTYISAHNLYYVTCMRHAYNDVKMFHQWKYFYVNIPDLLRERFNTSIYQELDDVKAYSDLTLSQKDNIRCTCKVKDDYIFEVPVIRTDFVTTNFILHKIAPTLVNLDFTDYHLDPNYWPPNLRKHNKMIQAFAMYCKNRTISNNLQKLKKYG